MAAACKKVYYTPGGGGALKGSLGGGVPSRPSNLYPETFIFCLCSAFFVRLVFHFPYRKYFFIYMNDIIE